MPISLPRLTFPSLSKKELRYLKIMLLDVRRPVPPAPHRPEPAAWPDDALTAAWLGHSTVLVNFYGVNILTDPVLGARAGLALGPLVVGPKRYVAAALTPQELPRIDLVLLSHAHMDHFDLRTLGRLRAGPRVVTARHTADLLRGTRLRRHATELGWGEQVRLPLGHTGDSARDEVEIEAFEVRHWGARLRSDDHRGYNGYILRRHGRAMLYAGDTASTPLFGQLRGRGGSASGGRFDLGIFPIGAYDPWIGSHCTPEQAVEMADAAGVRFVMPVHHQTFKLSQEPMDAPIRRFEQALSAHPERIALRAIGETFRLPP